MSILKKEDKDLDICIEKIPEKEVEKLTPKMVRKMLGIDNKEIADLCRQISLVPKKDVKGQTYFSREDVEVLKRIKKLHAASCVSSNVVNYPANREANVPVAVSPVDESIISTLNNIENKLVTKISKVIDEKLDGMDEVVVELIRCKTENENLRQKINELNKEIYKLKNENASFKSVGLNLYLKTPQKTSIF